MQPNSALESKLRTVEDRFGGGRLKRVLRHPYGSLLPVMQRRLGLKRPVTAETYYGTRFHGILPEAVSTQIWRAGYFAADVCRAIAHVLESGDQFVDIGSHFGFFSMLGAEITGPTGRTLSVEAMPQTYSYLDRNMAPYISRGTARLHQGAAFNTSCTLTFKDFGIVASSLNTAYDNRGVASLLEKPKEVVVQAERTDKILEAGGITKPKLIKIDAESAELFVLQGLEETLKAHRPALILEIGDSPDDAAPQAPRIFELLGSLGYRARSFQGRDLVPFDLNGPVPYANVLFEA